MTQIERTRQETTHAASPVPDPDRLEARRLDLMHSLGLPRVFFRGRNVCQIGGSAESALQYAIWGARITLIATDPQLHEHAERLFLRHRQPFTLASRDSIVSDPAQMARFEFVSCEEPLLYSPDPLRDLEVLVRNLARDGVLLAGIPEANVNRRRRIMQQAVRALSRGEAETRRHADEWFGGHIAATAKQRGAPRDAIRDALFLDPRGQTIDLGELCRLCASLDLTLLGSDPCVFGAGCRPGKTAFDVRLNHDHFEQLGREWSACGATVSPSQRDEPLRIRRERIEHEVASLRALENRIAQRDIDDALIERLAGNGETLDRLLVLLTKD